MHLHACDHRLIVSIDRCREFVLRNGYPEARKIMVKLKQEVESMKRTSLSADGLLLSRIPKEEEQCL